MEGEKPRTAGWEGDSEGLSGLNHTVWTEGNEEAWEPVKQERA